MPNITQLANSSGTEIGTASTPIRTDPTGTTAQPDNLTQVGGSAVSLGQKVMASSIPVVIASDQGLTVNTQSGVVSTNNSTTATLAGNATFTGVGDDSTNYNAVAIQVFADQASAAGGLSLQFSNDNANWDFKTTYTVAASTVFNIEIAPQARFFRIVYTNGASAQGTFRLQTILRVTTIQTVAPPGANPTGATAPGVLYVQGITGMNPLTENLTQVGGSNITLGQKTMANSVPVAIASDQSDVGVNIDKYGGTSTTLGQKAMASSMPVTVASDQASFPVSLQDLISTNNSSTATLAGNATFTGTGDDVSAYASVNLIVFADQASAANGLQLEYSTNNSNWDQVEQFTTTASTTFTIQSVPKARFFRVVYTNGASAQGTFRLQSIYKSVPGTPVTPFGTLATSAVNVQGKTGVVAALADSDQSTGALVSVATDYRRRTITSTNDPNINPVFRRGAIATTANNSLLNLTNATALPTLQTGTNFPAQNIDYTVPAGKVAHLTQFYSILYFPPNNVTVSVIVTWGTQTAIASLSAGTNLIWNRDFLGQQVLLTAGQTITVQVITTAAVTIEVELSIYEEPT